MDDNLLPQQSSIDTCHYTLNLSSTSTSSSDQLVSLLPTFLTFIANHSQQYIWHKQSFNLSISPLPFSPSNAAASQQYLEGKTDCTDCVDDEWFIVYLLRELSKLYEELVISVEDEDGQFLLIEGAEVLPKWVTPINAENRVWIHKGRLHLIPIQHISALPFEGEGESTSSSAKNPSFDAEEDGFIDRNEAINLVRDPIVNTLAPTQLEEIVFSRINIYPAKISQHLHRTLAYLPKDIALALADSPALISEAIAAFYEREPTSLRACNTMTRFPPSSTLDAYSPPSTSTTNTELTDSQNQNLIPTTVFIPTLLTRPLYSQLVLQRFFPPKPFEKVGWLDGAKGFGEEEERRRMVGMKIACGFEMLYKITSPQLRLPTEAFNTYEPKYQNFIKKLSSTGYFEGEIEGSAKYSAKELLARKGWEESLLDSVNNSKQKSFAQRVDESISRSLSLSSPLPDPITTRLKATEALALEDSEDWLLLDEENFEAMLESRGPKRGGLDDLDESDGESSEDDDEGEAVGDGMEGVEEGEGKGKGKEDRKARRMARDLKGMADKVEEFVEGRGAVDGAEFSDEQSDDEDSDLEEGPHHALSPEERLLRSNALVAPLSDLEWGQKSTSTSTSAPPPLLPTPTSNPLPLPPRAPKLTTNTYDGASSDDDSSDEGEPMNEGEEGLGGEEIEGEDGPTVIGKQVDEQDDDDDEMDGQGGEGKGEGEEMEMEMEEEMDEFLKFAMDTLGLTKEQYEKILSDRKERGAFVPGPAIVKRKNVIPTAKSTSTSSSTSTPVSDIPKSIPTPIISKPEVPKVPLRNPNLTDFDALMEQMDVELQKSRSTPSTSASSSKAKEKSNVKPNPSTKSKSTNPKAPFSTRTDKITIDSDPSSDEADNSADEEMESMDAELAALFKSAAGASGADGDPDGRDHEGNGTMDYNLVKNFLESFQSQGGFGGPAGNLSGRLGFKLPKSQ